jgi:hypothetical protein
MIPQTTNEQTGQMMIPPTTNEQTWQMMIPQTTNEQTWQMMIPQTTNEQNSINQNIFYFNSTNYVLITVEMYKISAAIYSSHKSTKYLPNYT